MKDNSSGITGILGIAGCVVLFLAVRKFFPSLATLMLWFAGIAGVVIVILIGLVIYFSVTGNKEKNDGVLILLSVGDRESRIEVGYGLEGVLTDAGTGRIQDQYKYKQNQPSF